MKKSNIYLLPFGILLFVFCINQGFAQQLPYTSHVSNTGFLWNPAMTAPKTTMNTSVFFRQQWINFDNAPRTAYVGFEYPWLDQNMSFGGAIINDKVGPVSKNGIKVTYSYKLEEIFNRDDQFSIGLSADFTQFSFDPTGEIFNDQTDQLLANARNSTFFPSVGAGIFYLSNLDEYDDNLFYFGISGTQVYSTQVLIERGNFDRAMHWFGTVGTKIFIDYRFMIEPKLNINLVNSELIDLMIGANFEMEETFWVGLGYSSASDVALQGGAIIPDLLARYSELRIGALANIGLSSDQINNFGPGFEFFLVYRYDLD